TRVTRIRRSERRWGAGDHIRKSERRPLLLPPLMADAERGARSGSPFSTTVLIDQLPPRGFAVRVGAGLAGSLRGVEDVAELGAARAGAVVSTPRSVLRGRAVLLEPPLRE